MKQKLNNTDFWPGFLIRRLQQISVSLFLNELAALDITPIQHTLLRLVDQMPGMDQTTVAKHAVLDRSTATNVLVRLEAKGLITRTPGLQDKRTFLLEITKQGKAVLPAAEPLVRRAQKLLLAPIPKSEWRKFVTTLENLVKFHEEAEYGDGEPRVWRRMRGGARRNLAKRPSPRSHQRTAQP